MDKTSLILVRHGQSEGNLKNLFLGHTDLDLTELGHLQAEKTADFLEAIPADRIVSSDLKRAYHTALHTARRKGMAVEKSVSLREIFAGDWENKPFSDLEARYRESFSFWETDFFRSRCDGGESVMELADRLEKEALRIAEENLGKTVLLFTHATPIRVLASLWKGADKEELSPLPWPTNASVTMAVYQKGAFSLLEYSRDDFMGDMVTGF